MSLPNSAKGARADGRRQQRALHKRMSRAIHGAQLRKARRLARVEAQRARMRRVSPARKEALLARDIGIQLRAHDRLSTLLHLSELGPFESVQYDQLMVDMHAPDPALD